MQKHHRRRIIAAAVVAAALAATPLAYVRAQHATTAGAGARQALEAGGSWDTFRADISIRQRYLGRDDQPERVSPPGVTFALERTWRDTHWRTVMTLETADRPFIRSGGITAAADNPFAVARLEYDEDGSAPRMHDRGGALLPSPSATARRLVHPSSSAAMWHVPWLTDEVPAPPIAGPGRDWIDALIARPDKLAQRRAALVARFGPPTASGEFDRFTETAGERTDELLVRRSTALPESILVRQRGVETTRIRLSYLAQGDVLTRHLMHVEEAPISPGAHRTVTDVQFDNIQLTARGTR